MSFSQVIKEELAGQYGSARHCQLAELAALIGGAGYVSVRSRGNVFLSIGSENIYVAGKAERLIRRAFHTAPETAVIVSGEQHGSRLYLTELTDPEQAGRVLMAVKYMNRGGVLREITLPAHSLLLRSACCRRAFLRGAFLAAGSVSDPRKSYHLEFVCIEEEKAEQIRDLIRSFGPEAKIVVRKEQYVVYLKDSDGIADLFNIMGAHRGLMEMENIRILRGISGNVNRTVNCETANLEKTVSAAVEQLRAIEKIRDTVGLHTLPLPLQEMAEVRLANPDAPLKDLGGLLDPPVGKSGVNHRLRKLRQIAEELSY